MSYDYLIQPMPITDHFAQYLKGAEKWNRWRRENPHIRPNLSGHRFVLVESHLRRTSKPGLNTTTYGMFMRHHFQDFDFSHTNFTDCVFWEGVFFRVNFQNAIFLNAEFRQCEFREVPFDGADLRDATFVLANFLNCQFNNAYFQHNHFAYSTFRDCQGLSNTTHFKEGQMDFLTLFHSNSLSVDYVKNFGITEAVFRRIQGYDKGRYRDTFISYSSKNESFVSSLRTILTRQGVPCFYAPFDYRINTKWYPKKIKTEYELHRDLYNILDACDRMILVLSNESMSSPHVRTEVQRTKKRDKVVAIQISDLNPELDAQLGWSKTFPTIDFRGVSDTKVLWEKLIVLLDYLVQR